ncbi:MAG TPA: TetR family transcriptional regulator [Streptomyces sp.]
MSTSGIPSTSSTPGTSSTSGAPSTSGDPSTPHSPAPARRDAETTKAAILMAARRLLARQARADITLKAVAERAGVSAPLVVKYFGNKDALFARVMSFEADTQALLDAPLEELGRHMVRCVVGGQREEGADPVLRIVFAPLHGEHGDGVRANFRTQVVDRLAARLPGPDAALRAELAMATLLGLGVMNGIARGEAVRATPVEEIVERYGPKVQAILTEPPSRAV